MDPNDDAVVHCPAITERLASVMSTGALPTLHDRYGISVRAMSARIKGWL